MKSQEEHAHEMGEDCAKNGPGDANCHSSLFASEEQSDAWWSGYNEERALIKKRKAPMTTHITALEKRMEER